MQCFRAKGCGFDGRLSASCHTVGPCKGAVFGYRYKILVPDLRVTSIIILGQVLRSSLTAGLSLPPDAFPFSQAGSSWAFFVSSVIPQFWAQTKPKAQQTKWASFEDRPFFPNETTTTTRGRVTRYNLWEGDPPILQHDASAGTDRSGKDGRALIEGVCQCMRESTFYRKRSPDRGHRSSDVCYYSAWPCDPGMATETTFDPGETLVAHR